MRVEDGLGSLIVANQRLSAAQEAPLSCSQQYHSTTRWAWPAHGSAAHVQTGGLTSDHMQRTFMSAYKRDGAGGRALVNAGASMDDVLAPVHAPHSRTPARQRPQHGAQLVSALQPQADLSAPVAAAGQPARWPRRRKNCRKGSTVKRHCSVVLAKQVLPTLVRPIGLPAGHMLIKACK